MLSLFGIALIVLPALLMRVLPGWADSREVEMIYREASVELHDRIEGGSLVLAPDIGVIGWYLNDASILDPIGLVSPVSLEYFDYRSEGEILSMRLVEDLKPDYIVSRAEFIQNLVTDEQFQNDYWQIQNHVSSLNPTTIVFTYARK